ncbi:MAG: AAA family ATPase [Aliarcobacter sp.]|nr:AAA family ATPase [Aliarcobacter sp.]
MKLLYIHIEEDYKHIKAGGYYFDREFIVKVFIPRGNKKIELETNENYHHPFNNNINNISCIVGKNGIGKTTFFELIIAPLLWKLDGSDLVGQIHLLFFDEESNNFLIQTYYANSKNWQVFLNGNNIDIYKNTYNQDDKNDLIDKNEYAYSVLPYQLNIIFHSLSPFDRIYDLLKTQLSSASNGQKRHYHKRLKYIGIKQIEKDETTYEYMTLINLISVLLDKKSKIMFNNLGYEYGDISINIENEKYYIDIELPEFRELKKEYSSFIESLFTEELYLELKEKLSFELKAEKIDDVFFKELIQKNLNLNGKNFIFLLNEVIEEEKKLTGILPVNLINSIYNFIRNIEFSEKLKYLVTSQNYYFLKDIFRNKELLISINNFNNDEYLENIIKTNDFLEILRLIKLLTRRNFIKFEVNLIKNNGKFNYLRLSSGEKTLLSYFANILGRIRELDEIQIQDTTYDNVKNKTYLILIDEVELHLHPEWQRNFIKQLNDFFTYEDDTKKFQFVIATHSPFVVSDIYDENIIYLGRDNINSKTFGGNIFDIFKDDFYVSNTIGAFSEEIIKELSEILYVLFAIKKAEKEDNFFMLRDFFDLMYKTDNKKDENEFLLKNIKEFIFGSVENEEFQKIGNNKYLEVINKSLEVFYKEINLIINNIGEDVIKEHLQKMFIYVRESND